MGEKKGTLQPLGLPPVQPSAPGTTFCSGGSSAASFGTHSKVTSAIKDKILFDSGKIIAKHVSGSASSTNPAFPSKKIVVIPFSTTDAPKSPNVDTAAIDAKFFGSGSTDQSIRNYFDENSWGQFVPTSGGVSDWVELPQPLSAYTSGTAIDFIRLERDVVSRASNIDWKTLDGNGDGTITNADATLVFLYPNADSALKKGFADTRPRKFDAMTAQGKFTIDGRVVFFSLVEASDPDPKSNPFRTFSTVAHELCHAMFDLPDRYANRTTPTGVGRYDLMASDRTWEHMTIYDKMKIGWIQPSFSYGHVGRCLSFEASESTASALVVVSPTVTGTGTLPASSSEYWMIENRHKPSSRGDFDQNLPESGLAVWWVQEGTAAGGYDTLRLVDFAKPDSPPNAYTNPTNSALFKRNDANPVRLLFADAGRSYAWVRGVSDAGATMFCEV